MFRSLAKSPRDFFDKLGMPAPFPGLAYRAMAELVGQSIKTAGNALTGKDAAARDEIWQAAQEGGKIAALMGMGGTVLNQGTAAAANRLAGWNQDRKTETWERVGEADVEKSWFDDYTNVNKAERIETPVYKTVREGGLIEDIDHLEMDRREQEGTRKYGLSQEEADSISHYVAGYAFEWSAIQRDEPGYEQTEYADFWISLATTAFEKIQKFHGRTYRNLRFTDRDKFRAFMNEHGSGNKVILRAFTSSSKDPNGYIVSGGYVVHLVIDGLSGRDISDTFSTPEQKEVVYLPGTVLRVDSVGTANDGNPIIYVQEVITDGKDLGADHYGNRKNSSAANYAGQAGYVEGTWDDLGPVHGNRGVLASVQEVAGQKVDPANTRTYKEINTNSIGEIKGETRETLTKPWNASQKQAYDMGLRDLPESAIPKGATRAQLTAYEAGRAESQRRVDKELSAVSTAQKTFYKWVFAYRTLWRVSFIGCIYRKIKPEFSY